MKNTAKTNPYNRSQAIRAIIALFVACSGLSTQAAAVQIPEEALELDRWDLPAGDLGQPIYNNPEAPQINAPLINVKGEVTGTNASLGKALQQTSIPFVPLQRVPLPGPATVSPVSPVARNGDGELTRSLKTFVECETHRFSFGPSENCRRFELVCSLIGIP